MSHEKLQDIIKKLQDDLQQKLSRTEIFYRVESSNKMDEKLSNIYEERKWRIYHGRKEKSD